MIEWWGPVIYEFYGSTESGAVTFANSEDALKKPGTVGKISPGAELRFIGDDGKELPQGEIGEIYSRIAGNPDFTYHNKPEKRAEIDRDGFITSGDVGYIDEDGYVFICDRKRDMVISGGVNIYPAEIEAALHAVPGVHDCAVFGIPDAEFGEALMAVVEPQPGVDARHRFGPRPAQDLAGRLQGAKTHRNPGQPAARGFRQDLQAPPARSLLGAGRAEDLASLAAVSALMVQERASASPRPAWPGHPRSWRGRTACMAGERCRGVRWHFARVHRLYLYLALRQKTCTLRNCRAASGVASHVSPDHAFRDREPRQSRRGRAGA